MDIGFEAKRFFTNKTGLGNYSRFVVEALSKYYPDSEYYLYTTRRTENPEALSILKNQNLHVITPGQLYEAFRVSSLWRSYAMTFDATLKTIGVYHGLSQELPFGLPATVKKVVTIHDLIYLRFPEFYNATDAYIYKAKAKSAIRLADRIVAVSKQTAEDLQQFFNVPSSKIDVIYQGCHENFKQTFTTKAIDDIKLKYQLPRDYILNVGTIEKRKNAMLLIEAIALMRPESRPPIVFMGGKTDYYKDLVAKAKSLGVSNCIIFLHNVPFEEFPLIYQGAKVFVYPSLFEGFGIPLIEAIYSKIPVITSLGSCFSEAAGPSSIYVDPSNKEELAHQITRLLADSGLQREMVEKSYEYVKKFEPSIIAKELITLYHR